MTRTRLWLILVILLSAALLVSLFFNVTLYRRSRFYYVQLNGVHLDPLGLSRFSTATRQPVRLQEGQQLAVFFGDSRAAEWKPPVGFDEQYRFVNRGIGGETSVQAAARYPYHVRPLQPDLLIVQVGANDLKSIPLFPHLEELILTNLKNSLQQIVSQAQDQGATVILTTIFPLGEVPLERRIVWSADVAEGLEGVNDYIHSLASDSVIIMDTVPVLANESGQVRPEYSLDLLHLNETGYAALNIELEKVLTEVSP